MRPIPLINAEHAFRVAGLLDAAGIPADRYLEQARISPGIREDSTGFLPGRSVWSLVANATRAEGLENLWLDVARLSDWRRAPWVVPMTHAATLLDAIRVMCSSYVRQIPMNRLGLSFDGPEAWFWRRRVADTHDWDGSEQAEQYTLSFMLEVIRTAAGADWLPERLEVESTSPGWAASTSRLRGVRIQFDQPRLAVAIPIPLLSIPVSITAHSTGRVEAESPATDFQGSLRQLLQPYLLGGLPTQELAADLLWTSPRTLRRRLAQEGTTWRAVIHDMIFSKAVDELQQGRATVREIAEELGYSDAEHFTRFFRSRAGIPPSAYRAEVERAKQLADSPYKRVINVR
jgi:AraC-like DNA-binding protein